MSSTWEWPLVTDRRPPSMGRRLVRWSVVRAPFAPGSLLVGPDPEGVKAFIPPGTLTRTVEGDCSRRGWREGVWTLDGPPAADVVESCPQRMERVSFLHFAVAVQVLASVQRCWVQRHARQHLDSLDLLIKRAALDADELRELQRERDDLLLDASQLFGQRWLCQQLTN